MISLAYIARLCVIPNQEKCWNTRFDASLAELALPIATEDMTNNDEDVEDDRLRLIFTCCHPALSREAQVALTLREVCGLTTEAIASAFLIPTQPGLTCVADSEEQSDC